MKKEIFKKNKLGAFIVPTGVGASIGGFAGDASTWARRFTKNSTLIVNPNVVNAGCFSGITENMLYVEGYSLDEFFKGNINLSPLPENHKNKIGVVFDKGISDEVLNVHINTINAVKTVYDLDIIYEVTEKAVDVNFFIDNSGTSTGEIDHIETLLQTAKNLITNGAKAIAVVCKFNESDENKDYENGIGVDPIGGMEAIISHYLSRELKVPTAHSPAFEDFSVSSKIVDAKASAEYITPTFLPCILIGLSQAPQIINPSPARGEGERPQTLLTSHLSPLSASDLDFLIMPYNSLGSIPVFEASKRGIKIYAIKENKTVLNITKDLLSLDNIIEVETYQECLNIIKN